MRILNVEHLENAFRNNAHPIGNEEVGFTLDEILNIINSQAIIYDIERVTRDLNYRIEFLQQGN